MHECSYISLRENASKDAILLVASFDQAYAERSVDKDVEQKEMQKVYGYTLVTSIFFPCDALRYSMFFIIY